MVKKAADKSTPAKRVKKTATPVEPVNEVVAAPAVEEVAEDVPVSATATVVGKMGEFGAKLMQMTSLLSTLKSDFKTLEKSISREMKVLEKASNKGRRSNANRKPSGFIKPTLISDELAAFLGKSVGTEMARTAVSKEINNYIQTHNLKDKNNGRIIHADAKLTKLLKLSKDDELTYFNLQKYMKHHFPKTASA
uniref:DM2 domain-containing protein n=1 Tax=viral metagenome TaxID=1070528 RepID=A0A6C0ATI7_9ZZZZ|tara:strand:+ start:7617 stop:8198 length:582 start_codon:yes stop_codon:yes gene_type:complete